MSNSKIAWGNVDWQSVNKRITRYQERIYKSSKENNRNKTRFLQKQIINSLDAKLLAVKRVTTENKGRKTAGIDKLSYKTDVEKSLLVDELRVDGKASPIKRIYIPKPETVEKRPLVGNLTTISDRAKQYIILLALEPEWEARFEPNSYGFRPGRSCHDVVQAIYQQLKLGRNKTDFKNYVLDADIKGCFDNINHDYLLDKLDTLPEIRKQVKSWLEAGITEDYLSANKYSLVPANRLGTAQGGIISPFLANVALHGMENHLKQWISEVPSKIEYLSSGKRNYPSKRSKMSALGVIRYADAFLVIYKDKETLLEIKNELQKWLNTISGLELNESKTSIVCADNGFSFLGFRFINVMRHGKKRIKIYPDTSSIKSILQRVGEIIQNNKAVSSDELIKMLRPVIIGWGNYYSTCECSSTFSKVENRIYGMLRAWVFRRDRRNSRSIIKENYFPSGQTYTFRNVKHHDNWVLFGKTKDKNNETKTTFLPHLQWVKSRRHVQVLGNSSVYDGKNAYWALRSQKYGNWSPTQRKLLKLQNGICSFCKSKILFDELIEVDHIKPISQGGKGTYSHLQ
jgi:RNA-directed DNA polymerase